MPMTNGVLTVLPAPPGYIVDFDNPQRQAANETYVVAAVGNFLCLLFMSQRLYTKIRIMNLVQIEDYILIGAWLTSIATQAVLIRGFATGVLGVHAWEIATSRYNIYSILISASPIVYAPCSGFAKLTLLIFYQRISPQRWFQWSVWATMFIVVGYTIGIFFSLIFACNPIQRSWDISITTGSCIDTPALYVATAALGIATDLILLVLPIPMVIGLQMPMRQKAGLLVMFTIGSMTLITSIVRLVILLPVLTNKDQPWAIAFPCTWICVEANLLVICGSLPTLRKFFRHVAPKIIGESYSDQTPPASLTPGLRTFGKASTRKHYDKFGDTDYTMNTLQGGGDEEQNQTHLRPDPIQERENQVGSDNHTWDPRDDNSEKAIVQTRTTVVSYGNRPGHDVPLQENKGNVRNSNQANGGYGQTR